NCDTLYRIGEERHKIGSISQADLLTLKLNYINAKNDLQNSEITLKRSSIQLANFLRFKSNTEFILILPENPPPLYISQEEALVYAKANNPQMIQMAEQLLQAQQQLDKTKKESRFSASISASVGFNQVAGNFIDAYRKPLQQDMVTIGMTIPILDWGVKKGRVNMAKSNLNVTTVSLQQEEQSFEQDIIMTVSDFNVRMSQILSAGDARNVADMAYDETKQRFLIGKTDVNSVNSALNNRTQAQRNYINALSNYWECYYKIRKMTMYDFFNKKNVADKYEKIVGLNEH
ncbi:MAG: TolC family protein, partial [Bacteroidaceae bacterium]